MRSASLAASVALAPRAMVATSPGTTLAMVKINNDVPNNTKIPINSRFIMYLITTLHLLLPAKRMLQNHIFEIINMFYFAAEPFINLTFDPDYTQIQNKPDYNHLHTVKHHLALQMAR